MPDHLANMIAAGEVVERPSSVVKELVENALDASSTSIAVELVAAGKREIRVIDNGTGMDSDDAVLAFERHATSKIVTTDDLDTISTYGFRGEALPSVASVSKTTIQTCNDDSGLGTEVVMDGGQLRTVRETGRTRGTTVLVRDLFFNVPARRKFLRTENTELRHISRELTGLTLGRPDLEVRLSHSGRVLLECQSTDGWQERLRSLFGREIIHRGLSLDETSAHGRIYGLLGRPGDAGSGYTEQYLLVNGRMIQSRLLRKAILDGYEATQASGGQPFFVIFLEVDPGAVDVNVHPQKKEVRFRDERGLFGFVKQSIASLFADVGKSETQDLDQELPVEGQRASGVPGFWTNQPTKQAGESVSDFTSEYRTTPSTPVRDSAPPEPSDRVAAASDGPPADDFRENVATGVPSETSQPQKSGKRKKSDEQLNLKLAAPEGSSIDISGASPEEANHLWQFQGKYIFVSTNDGLWIIDQHVAHERILYEEAMSAFAGEAPTSQRLLFPLTIELSPEQDAALDDVVEMLESMGFAIQRLSGRSILIDAYPASVKKVDDGGVIRQMIEEVCVPGFKRTGMREQLGASYSCHAAIKAGERLEMREMRWLVERLFNTSMPYVCPHGRPTVVRIAMSELDTRFGRT
jgi:DNA mismatch repair protein MutL